MLLGPSRVLGESLFQLHQEHIPVIQHFDSLIKAFPSEMIIPLRGESEEFKMRLNHLDKFHCKSYKQKKGIIKQKKTDLKKLEKKLCNKEGF